MKQTYFESLEHASGGTTFEADKIINQLAFNADGLIPVIAQDAVSKRVLMLAWMNKEALEQTLLTQRMTYWSRSRNEFWVKGKTSGNTQVLVSMSFDCDGDAILCNVNQTGGACHTGRADCFYLKVNREKNTVYIAESEMP